MQIRFFNFCRNELVCVCVCVRVKRRFLHVRLHFVFITQVKIMSSALFALFCLENFVLLTPFYQCNMFCRCFSPRRNLLVSSLTLTLVVRRFYFIGVSFFCCCVFSISCFVRAHWNVRQHTSNAIANRKLPHFDARSNKPILAKRKLLFLPCPRNNRKIPNIQLLHNIKCYIIAIQV